MEFFGIGNNGEIILKKNDKLNIINYGDDCFDKLTIDVGNTNTLFCFLFEKVIITERIYKRNFRK